MMAMTDGQEDGKHRWWDIENDVCDTKASSRRPHSGRGGVDFTRKNWTATFENIVQSYTT
jgi:hypothetical protein